MPPAKQTSLASDAAAVVNWQHKLWCQVNEHWTNTTGDLQNLLGFDAVAYHLYGWAVETGRVAKEPTYPFHRVCSLIASAFKTDTAAFKDEANKYIRARMAERQAQLDKITEELRVKEEERRAAQVKHEQEAAV